MRVRALLALEVRVQWRYGIVAMVAALTAAWTGLLLVLPDQAAGVVAPWLLMLETAVLGSTLAGALVLLERGYGMRAALAVSPARTGEYLTAKLGFLTALVLASAVPVALAGRPAALAPVLLGVGLTALLTMLVAVAVAVPRQSVISFMIVLPLVLLPLLAPAVAHGAGLRHPLLYASPVTGAMDLVLTGSAPAWSAAWLLLAITLAASWAARRSGGDQPRRGPTFAWTWDPLLVVIGASPLLLGVATRFGYSPLHDWLLRAYGFDLDPYRPLLLAVAVVLHVPVTFGMVGALLVFDDVDDRAIVALRVSPLTLPRYLARRAGLVAAATLAGLLVAVPLSGLGSLGPWLLPAALLAPLVMLAALAVATNKVEGLAVLKLLGLPLYAPLATWWLTGPSSWPFAVLPSWWVVRSLWSGEPAPALGYAAAGLALTAVALGLLSRRALALLRAA
jgi:fluoroquinolone transport system permease protein